MVAFKPPDPDKYGAVQESSSRATLAEGMSLYGLVDSELFWDKGSDTKMLMAWNRNTIVCSFRGTASFNNAMSDLQVPLCSVSACQKARQAR